MKIIADGDYLEVYTPYNIEFITCIKTSIGGSKWNPEKKCWIVPSESLAEIRQLMLMYYGKNDIETPDYVSVKLTFSEPIYGSPKGITIFGKTVARAYGRDTVGAIDKDVAYIKGQPLSGGSRNHPLAWIDKGAEIVLHNVPKPLLKSEIPESIKVEVVNNQEPVPPSSLQYLTNKQAELERELEDVKQQIKKEIQKLRK